MVIGLMGQPCTKGDCVIWADTESTQVLLAQRVQDWDLSTDRILIPLADALGDFRVDDAKEWGELSSKVDTLGDPLQMNNIGQREFNKIIEAASIR